MIMVIVNSNNTVEDMSGFSISRVHSSIQQKPGDNNLLAEAEVFDLHTSYEHNIVPDIEIVEETWQA